jgi:hypothetical protein
MARLYIDKKRNPILRASFCLFLDALGFNNLIEEATKNGTADALLKEFFDVLKESSKHWSSMGATWEYKCFTDNVVFGCPIPNSQDSESEFGVIFTTAGFHQLEMALAGFFVRGGMSLGPLHMSPNIVFGQACLDAYKLESKKAVFPRTVLDQKVMAEVYKHLRFYAHVKASPHDEGILIDEDSQFFLNYLDALIDGSSAEDISFDGFERHRDLVTIKLAEMKDDAAVFPKYEWVARYHNYVIDAQVQPLLDAYGEGDDGTPLKVAGYHSQECQTLSEFMKGDIVLYKRFKGKLW